MNHFTLRAQFPNSAPLISGAALTPFGFHSSHAAHGDRPYLPATALRGSMRETLEAVLRGSGEHRACSGGDGVDPTASERAATPCALGSDGGPCLTCRLFGTRRGQIGDGERAFSGLVLGDARLDGEAAWATRPSVALSRPSRSAAEHHLRMQRVPDATGEQPLLFVAEGWLRDPALQPYLEAAVRATAHIGSGRSRGLARVELSVQWHRATPAPVVVSTSDVRIRIELTSPALIGASFIDANFRETRPDLPGSAVRGGVGFALRELLDDLDGDRAAQELLDAARGAQFGFCYLVDSKATPPHALSGPLPITAAACKRRPSEHGIVDTLLDRLALQHANSSEEAERVLRDTATKCTVCKESLHGAPGTRGCAERPPTQSIVRVAMDRTRQSARDGQLFAQVLLAPGVTLEGTIRNIPASGQAHLANALGSNILSFGRGRSSGWGRARITVQAAPVLPSIKDRAAAFDRALRKRLDRAKLSTEGVGRLVAVTLHSPLWPALGDPDGAQALCEALDADCFLAARRFSREGAWDQRRGELQSTLATSAGGVFVFELRKATWSDSINRLDALERDGIGQRREQGFGQLLCFDPHFLIASQNG